MYSMANSLPITVLQLKNLLWIRGPNYINTIYDGLRHYYSVSAFHNNSPDTTTVYFISWDIIKWSHNFIFEILINPPYYRLILTAVLVTSKFYNDVFYGNHFVAYVGGVCLQELNLLEASFLELVEWRVWVEPVAEFEVYLLGVLR